MATAVASDPPLPMVVISPCSDIPWNPGIIAIPLFVKKLLTLSIFIFIILELLCSPLVKIVICQPIKLFDLIPKLFNAPASKAEVTCSPDANKTSNSLLLKFLLICSECFINSLVFPAIAETTAIILSPFKNFFFKIFATDIIFSTLPTEVPPNLTTIFAIFKILFLDINILI